MESKIKKKANIDRREGHYVQIENMVLTYHIPHKNQTVADFRSSQNDLIHGFFVENCPTDSHCRPELFAQHSQFAGILEIQIKIVFQEIEKR